MQSHHSSAAWNIENTLHVVSLTWMQYITTPEDVLAPNATLQTKISLKLRISQTFNFYCIQLPYQTSLSARLVLCYSIPLKWNAHHFNSSVASIWCIFIQFAFGFKMRFIVIDPNRNPNPFFPAWWPSFSEVSSSSVVGVNIEIVLADNDALRTALNTPTGTPRLPWCVLLISSCSRVLLPSLTETI